MSTSARPAGKRPAVGQLNPVGGLMALSRSVNGDDVEGAYIKDLKARLAKYGISQGAVARELGIQATAVSRWMTGQVTPSLISVIRIERAVAAIYERRQKEKDKAAKRKRK